MSKTLSSRRAPVPRAPACVEALPARTLLSVSPALAQNLLDHGYEKINWKGHETFVEPGKWIVSLRNLRGPQSTQLADAASRLSKAAPHAGLRVTGPIGNEGMFRVDAPAGARLKDVRAALGRMRGAKFAEPDFALWAQDLEEPAPQSLPPNDPRSEE